MLLWMGIIDDGYYRPFIKNFAAMASPLTKKLLKKKVHFHWYTAQETSFFDLKEALTNAPVLGFQIMRFL